MIIENSLNSIVNEKEREFYKRIFNRGSEILKEKSSDLLLLRDDDVDYNENFKNYSVYEQIMNMPVVTRFKIPDLKSKASINVCRFNRMSEGKFLSFRGVKHKYALVTKTTYTSARAILKRSIKEIEPLSKVLRDITKFLCQALKVERISTLTVKINYDPFDRGGVGFVLEFWSNEKPSKFGTMVRNGSSLKVIDTKGGYWEDLGKYKWKFTGTSEEVSKEVCRALNSKPLGHTFTCDCNCIKCGYLAVTNLEVEFPFSGKPIIKTIELE